MVSENFSTSISIIEERKDVLLDTRFQKSPKRAERKHLSAPIVNYQSNGDAYILTTDASLTGVGAISTQKQEGLVRVIAYAGKTLTKSQRNYSAANCGVSTVVHFTDHFRFIYWVGTL